MGEVLFLSNNLTRPVVSAFVDRIMARPAENDAVVERVIAAKFYVPHMMSVGNFTKSVPGLACFAEAEYRCSATRTSVPLPSQCKLLDCRGEFVRSIHMVQEFDAKQFSARSS